MKIKSATQEYEVGKKVATNAFSRLYLCEPVGTDRVCLLQAAADQVQNGQIDRIAFMLTELQRHSDELQAEYDIVKTDPDAKLGYDLSFPELLDSFVRTDGSGQRVNILAFRDVLDVRSMVPLANIIERDRLFVDLRTSAWVLGKLLKLFVFTHSYGIEVGAVDTTSILIEPDKHYSVLFDWSKAVLHPEGVPKAIRAKEISQAARSVIVLAGGDPDADAMPDTEEMKPSLAYTDYLFYLADGREREAKSAHGDFYRLIDELWKKSFHPFTAMPRTR